MVDILKNRFCSSSFKSLVIGRVVLTLCLSALVFSKTTLASEAELKKFLDEVTTMSAQFDQSIFDESGRRLSNSSGMLYLMRPGKFRWDYYSEFGDVSADGEQEIGQQIVADGEHIFMFDPDLEQVTKRSLEDALNQVPSLMLVQTKAVLEQYFLVADIGDTDGLSWVSLKPKSDNAGYQQLMMGFAQGELSAIVLLDGIGNETRLNFSALQINTDLNENHFDFEVPKGADLLQD